MEDCYAWCDAQIVLHWIRSSMPVGNSLVDNYVSHIQEITPSTIWRYVPTQMNPADIASRGTELEVLLRDRSWFGGTDWLCGSPSTWPIASLDLASVNAVQTSTSTSAPTPTDVELLTKFSDLYVLLRFLLRVSRWIRQKLQRTPTLAVPSPATATELNDAFIVCVKLSQRHHFSSELRSLKEARGVISRQSPLKGLDAFIDPVGALRVGGRLQGSSLSYNERHPPVVSGACPLSQLMIAWAHQRSLHGGFRSTYVQVVRSAWIIGGRRRIRAHIHRCLTCARTQARPLEQTMAHLPPERVNPVRAFTHTGLDYAGPFNLHAAKGRGSRTTKAYVAVFVCFASKGLHLEAVGDLSTESLQGALIRFVGRREKPAEIWSDNATHFHRADLEMKQALGAIHWNQVADSLATEGITWRFIPPAASHFGRLWEAGVKSFKTHLKRIAGPKNLTYEEFSTLLVSIETVLNCRPLSPLSSDLEDLEVLTPGHLLIGGPLGTIPEIVTDAEDLDRVTHWKLVKGMRDQC